MIKNTELYFISRIKQIQDLTDIPYQKIKKDVLEELGLLNFNMYSQRGRWEQGLCPVGGDCYHTILNPIFKTKFCFYFMLDIGAMAIAPYGFSKALKHYNLTYFSQKLFFNVKIIKKP